MLNSRASVTPTVWPKCFDLQGSKVLKEVPQRQPVGFLTLAIVLVFSSHALPAWLVGMAKYFEWPLVKTLGTVNSEQLLFLIFAIALVAHDPTGYGLRLGDNLRKKWPRLLGLCVTPIGITALVYPFLPSKPFSGGPIAIWLISPPAQDLFFAGYLYRWFSIHFPGTITESIKINRCILLTASCFSIWHIPGVAYGIGSFIWFQLAYTFLGACLMGIIRQWTGSIVYIMLVHVAVNFIATYF